MTNADQLATLRIGEVPSWISTRRYPAWWRLLNRRSAVTQTRSRRATSEGLMQIQRSYGVRTKSGVVRSIAQNRSFGHDGRYRNFMPTPGPQPSDDLPSDYAKADKYAQHTRK